MHPPTKIAILGNNWFPDKPGGLDRYIYELVHTLVKSETQIDLFGIGLPTSTKTSSIQLKNLAEPTASLGHRLYSAYRNSHSLISSKPDAINLHFALYGLAAIPNLPKDVPVTCTFHGPWAIESRQEGDSKLSVWFKKQMEQKVYSRCDRFIVLSKAFGQILHQEYHIPWDKIHIIPGGVDTQKFQKNLSRQEAREKLGWPQDRFIIFTPRRLVHRMGLDKLLNAISQLKAEKYDLWLAIAGKGPLRDTLEKQTIELSLNNSVKFLGFLPDEALPIAYQAADLTIMPSQSLEGFGLVLLESLASGTPVLCTPVGGMPEVIRDFSPALITDSPNEQAIATTLKAILTDKIQLPNREDCQDYATTRFSWLTIAEQVKQVLLQSH
ncbi:glycosyltransferase family 4 protein [Leptothoe spongobia]|uniref:Glycosyltransferase family 4 protein n=1 Tax=Leptothoe spongobia TAU-MAC 1115 TaxID=1967444 RepID=A0A947GQX8_9CYAN|nr:glycosyltransferase family 4 protein [Leptothoe spongobia]MBT9317261.1 glycosyltransferase family 4 protein [Leptothoe spongobia TAU-MAC 1115]